MFHPPQVTRADPEMPFGVSFFVLFFVLPILRRRMSREEGDGEEKRFDPDLSY